MERLGHMHLKENIQCAHTLTDTSTCAKDVTGIRECQIMVEIFYLLSQLSLRWKDVA
jgi:hypothetical protein